MTFRLRENRRPGGKCVSHNVSLLTGINIAPRQATFKNHYMPYPVWDTATPRRRADGLEGTETTHRGEAGESRPETNRRFQNAIL